jgi:hypothetical protein
MIIGFSGGMGVGKSTAVKILSGLLYRASSCRPPHLIKFAQPLYDIQEYAYDRIEGAYKRPDTFIKDRKLLQWLGTEWGRDTLSKSLWVDVWKTDAEIAIAKGYTVICDDVRFDNEAQAIKDLGGHILSITSNKVAERINVTGIIGHASEAGIHNGFIDKVITNDASYDEYVEQLESVFRSLGIK